jgi:hypothetical protein
MTLVFFTAWIIGILSLGIAVFGLWAIFRYLDSDFGIEGLVREISIVFVTSFLQALFFVFVIKAIGLDKPPPFPIIFDMAFALTYVVYKVTHMTQMSDKEIAILTVSNYAVYMILMMLSRQLLGVELPMVFVIPTHGRK